MLSETRIRRAVFLALALALVAAACTRREAAAPAPPAPKPIPIARPRSPAPDAARPAFPDSCPQILRTLAPDIDVHDDRIVLVMFVAQWAMASREMGPVMESELARDPHRWRFLKADVTNQDSPGRICGVDVIPTLIAFVHGRPVSQFEGFLSAGRVRQFLEAIPTNAP